MCGRLRVGKGMNQPAASSASRERLVITAGSDNVSREPGAWPNSKASVSLPDQPISSEQVPRGHVAIGRLERSLPDLPPPSIALSAGRSNLPAKTHRFLDFLAGLAGLAGLLLRQRHPRHGSLRRTTRYAMRVTQVGAQGCALSYCCLSAAISMAYPKLCRLRPHREET